MKKIKLGEANWSELCEPLEFFKIYTLYIQVDIRANNVSDLRLWKLEVEPLWRKFILQVFRPIHNICIHFEILFHNISGC
jgi:hypothetical protein